MTSLPFEQSGKWSVKHGQDFLADIVNTRNMDFSSGNFATIAKKPVCIYNTDTSPDGNLFGTVTAIVPIVSSGGSSTTYTIVTSNKVYQWSADTTMVTLNDINTPTMGLWSDGIAYPVSGTQVPLVTGTTKAAYYSGGAWHDAIAATAFSASYPHPMCIVEHLGGAPFLVGDGNLVHQYDNMFSEVTANKLVLPTQYVVTGMRWRAGNVYIATRNITGGQAKLFVWNGTGATAVGGGWDVKADWIYSLEDFDDSIVILTSAGQLLRFNGGGFTELAYFPVYDSPYSWASPSALTNPIGRCGNRGMTAHGGVLYMNIDGALNVPLTDTPGRYIPEQPSGLWCYDPDIGLYHMAGYRYTKYNEASYTFASSNFVFASAHNMQTGDLVYPTNTTGLTGVTVNQLYYAIVANSTSIQLARSQSDALNGTYMTITGTVAAGTMIIETFNTMGSVFTQSFPGAVCPFITNNPTPSILGSLLMYAGTVTKADNTTTSSLMSLGTGHGIASFTTTPIPASAVTDSFTKIIQFISVMSLHDSKIIVKYRTFTDFGLPNQYRKTTDGMVTWASTSSFTVDTTKKDFTSVQIGNEIEIIEGAAAGYTAHITAIDTSTSTYTVTIDEVLPVSVSDRSEIIADNWIKKTAVTYNSTGVEKLFAETGNLAANGTYVQFKVEIRGMDIGVRKLDSINSPSKSPA